MSGQQISGWWQISGWQFPGQARVGPARAAALFGANVTRSRDAGSCDVIMPRLLGKGACSSYFRRVGVFFQHFLTFFLTFRFMLFLCYFNVFLNVLFCAILTFYYMLFYRFFYVISYVTLTLFQRFFFTFPIDLVVI